MTAPPQLQPPSPFLQNNNASRGKHLGPTANARRTRQKARDRPSQVTKLYYKIISANTHPPADGANPTKTATTPKRPPTTRPTTTTELEGVVLAWQSRACRRRFSRRQHQDTVRSVNGVYHTTREILLPDPLRSPPTQLHVVGLIHQSSPSRRQGGGGLSVSCRGPFWPLVWSL